MGAEIVNLRRARKAKTRSEKDKTAEVNRIAHGAPKAAEEAGGSAPGSR